MYIYCELENKLFMLFFSVKELPLKTQDFETEWRKCLKTNVSKWKEICGSSCNLENNINCTVNKA